MITLARHGYQKIDLIAAFSHTAADKYSPVVQTFGRPFILELDFTVPSACTTVLKIEGTLSSVLAAETSPSAWTLMPFLSSGTEVTSLTVNATGYSFINFYDGMADFVRVWFDITSGTGTINHLWLMTKA